MRRARLPIVFLAVGLAAKGLLVILWRSLHIPGLLPILTTYDPGAFLFAERVTTILFDPRRLAPQLQEALLFELLLVVGFGIECFLLGLFTHWLLTRVRRPATRVAGTRL